jgi:hypothetical protein
MLEMAQAGGHNPTLSGQLRILQLPQATAQAQTTHEQITSTDTQQQITAQSL